MQCFISGLLSAQDYLSACHDFQTLTYSHKFVCYMLDLHDASVRLWRNSQRCSEIPAKCQSEPILLRLLRPPMRVGLGCLHRRIRIVRLGTRQRQNVLTDKG